MFARELNDELASLVKKLDRIVGENQTKKMAGFVVILTEDPDAAETAVKKFAKKHGIENIPLTTFGSASGPPSYKIAKDAAVTVHMWRKIKVKSNHAFAEGELNAAAIKAVVADTSKILD